MVDCGQIKVTTYDPSTNTSTLAPVLVSKANAAQRRGRAGRLVFASLFTLTSVAFSPRTATPTFDRFIQLDLFQRFWDVISTAWLGCTQFYI